MSDKKMIEPIDPSTETKAEGVPISPIPFKKPSKEIAKPSKDEKTDS